jgi:hypothetical protein
MNCATARTVHEPMTGFTIDGAGGMPGMGHRVIRAPDDMLSGATA